MGIKKRILATAASRRRFFYATLTTTILGSLLLFAPALAAAVSPASPPVHAQVNGPASCVSTWVAEVDGVPPISGKGHWIDDDCNFLGRIHLVCDDVTGAHVFANGGWEHRDGLVDGQFCPAAFPSVAEAAWEANRSNPTYCWFYKNGHSIVPPQCNQSPTAKDNGVVVTLAAVQPRPLAVTRYYHLCDNPDNLCLRDPSDGGTGTHVLMSPETGSHAGTWQVLNDSSFCNNTGVISLGCGLPAFIFNRYHGKRVYFLPNQGSGKCVRFTASHNWLGVMGGCGNNGSLLIGSRQRSGYWFFPALEASESAGAVRWMCGNNLSLQPYAGTACADAAWGLFR